MSEIKVHVVETEQETKEFWSRLCTHFAQDVFPEGGEDLEYFQGKEYRETVERLRLRERDPLRFLFFEREGRTIGFAMPVIYASEDGKCFILEFNIYPEFRGNGTGTACAQTLMNWAEDQGAAYFELNAAREDRRRFWGRLGFLPNGLDEWGEPLMRRPQTVDG